MPWWSRKAKRQRPPLNRCQYTILCRANVESKWGTSPCGHCWVYHLRTLASLWCTSKLHLQFCELSRDLQLFHLMIGYQISSASNVHQVACSIWFKCFSNLGVIHVGKMSLWGKHFPKLTHWNSKRKGQFCSSLILENIPLHLSNIFFQN